MTVVVVDNDGGGIFHFLAQHEELEAETFETVFGTPHGQDLAAVAGGFGLDVEVVTTRGGLTAALAGAVTRGGVKVVIVRSDRIRNLELHRRIQEIVTGALHRLEPSPSGSTGLEWGSWRPLVTKATMQP